MARLWQSGAGLVVLLAIVGSASAQSPKEFGKKGFGPKEFGKKKFDGGKGNSPEVDRIRAEMKELQGQIDRLTEQIDDTSARLDRLQNSMRTQGPAGRGEGKGPPMAGRGGAGPTPNGGFSKGGPGFKGPAFGGGGFGMQSKGPANAPGYMGPPPFAGGVAGPGGPDSGFGPRNDNLEEHLNRIERSIEELRREIRNRR